MISFNEVRKNTSIRALINAANQHMAAMGYTDHGPRHVGYVSKTAGYILQMLKYPPETIELAAIAGWVHDVGICINRNNHGPSGAILLLPMLRDMGMPIQDAISVVSAVGNHEESSGHIATPIAATLAIADKSDAHRTRVRHMRPQPDDIHDRVNYSIQENKVIVDYEKRIISHELLMDNTSSVMEFLNIYMSRVAMCEHAARQLECSFKLIVNDVSINN